MSARLDALRAAVVGSPAVREQMLGSASPFRCGQMVWLVDEEAGGVTRYRRVQGLARDRVLLDGRWWPAGAVGASREGAGMDGASAGAGADGAAR